MIHQTPHFVVEENRGTLRFDACVGKKNPRTELDPLLQQALVSRAKSCSMDRACVFCKESCYGDVAHPVSLSSSVEIDLLSIFEGHF